MGNDISRDVTEIESDNMTSKNCPLQFHDVHGCNIVLARNKRMAHRSAESFNDGITFTNRPVKAHEAVVFKIRETATNWSGSLRIGFTINDPKSMKSRVPSHSCPDLVSIPGNWAKALPESVNQEDAILSFHVDDNGDVYYNVDKGESKFLLSGVYISDKMWGVIDIYGNTVSLEFLKPNSPECEEDDFAPTLNLAFHKVHGRSATLRNRRLIAARKYGSAPYPYVFTDRPLKFNEKIIVQVLKTDDIHVGPLEYGITSCDPSSVQSETLPEDANDLLDWPDYWLPRSDSTPYRANDIIMFNMSPDGKFRVMKNGNSVSKVFHVDTSQSLWLFLKLSGSIIEICLLGSSAGEYADIMKKFHHLTVSYPEEEEIALAASSSAWENAATSSPSECVICCEKPIDCALYRCGHMCMCFECAQRMWTSDSKVLCPICRETIKDIIKVYK